MLETVVSHLDEGLTDLIGRLSSDGPGVADATMHDALAAAARLHRLIDLAGSVINGSASAEAVDSLDQEAAPGGDEHFTQDDIDSLFD